MLIPLVCSLPAPALLLPQVDQGQPGLQKDMKDQPVSEQLPTQHGELSSAASPGARRCAYRPSAQRLLTCPDLTPCGMLQVMRRC
jgi:hypothetical protein